MTTVRYLGLLLILVSTFPTSSPAQIQSAPLEATFWATIDAQGSPVICQFESRGRFSYIPVTGVISRGRWKQQGVRVQMEVNSGFVVFQGIIEGDRIEGTAITKRGVHWKWTATKQPVVSSTAPIYYPPLAAAARIQGSVIVKVKISKEGNVAAILSITGHPLLKMAVEDVAKNWRFQPIEEDRERTAGLSFTFNLVDHTGDLKGMLLSPYQVLIKRGPNSIHHLNSQTSSVEQR